MHKCKAILFNVGSIDLKALNLIGQCTMVKSQHLMVSGYWYFIKCAYQLVSIGCMSTGCKLHSIQSPGVNQSWVQ